MPKDTLSEEDFVSVAAVQIGENYWAAAVLTGDEENFPIAQAKFAGDAERALELLSIDGPVGLVRYESVEAYETNRPMPMTFEGLPEAAAPSTFDAA